MQSFGGKPAGQASGYDADTLLPTVVNVLGLPVAAWTIDRLLDTVFGWAAELDGGASGEPKTIFYANVHVVNEAQKDTALRDALRGGSTIYCDGSGVRLGAWVLGRSLPPRFTGADWIRPFCERAARQQVPVYVLAGREGVARAAGSILAGRYPGLNVVGTHHGYIADHHSATVIQSINAAGPRVLLVGMGTPRQELWIRRYRDRLDVPVVWAVGALFDFVTGDQRRGPGWMVEHHMEWLGRLLSDPRRLWRRYLLGNPLFVLRIMRQLLGGASRAP